MKQFFLMLSVLQIISCNSNSEKSNIKNYSQDHNEIFDSWAMYATSSNGTIFQMNTSPTITFMNNGTGYVVENTLITESFGWTLQKESMKIIYRNKGINQTFPDTFYYANFNREKDIINLTLRHNDNFFFLSKFARSK